MQCKNADACKEGYEWNDLQSTCKMIMTAANLAEAGLNPNRKYFQGKLKQEVLVVETADLVKGEEKNFKVGETIVNLEEITRIFEEPADIELEEGAEIKFIDQVTGIKVKITREGGKTKTTF